MCFVKSRTGIIAGVFLLISASLVLAEEETATDLSKTKRVLTLEFAHIDFEIHAQNALVNELKEKEVVWLDAEYRMPEGSGASSPGSIKVLALQRPSHKAQQHGAVLILPEMGQHADWPSVIRPLRSQLPESGWYTLSLSLPRTFVSMESTPQTELTR